MGLMLLLPRIRRLWLAGKWSIVRLHHDYLSNELELTSEEGE